MRALRQVKRRWRWLAALIVMLWLAVLAADRLWPLPLQEVAPARVVVAEDGTPLWRFADQQGVWRYPVALNDVSPRYLQALIQYEDRWFWRHPGVNPFAVFRAAWQDLTAGRVISGGSTLTMQVARLLDPHPRTFGGKLRQLWRALQLEWHLSKSEILTLYLNRAPFGGTLQGIGAASWAYLGKPPRNSAMAKRRCWPCCRRRQVVYVPIAGRSGLRPRGIKSWRGCAARASGPLRRHRKRLKNRYGCFHDRCRSWHRFFPADTGEQPQRESGDDARCRAPAAAGRSGAQLEIAPAAA